MRIYNAEQQGRADIITKAKAETGFTRKTLEGWGVPWPPAKGWRKSLVYSGIPYNGIPITRGTPAHLCDTSADVDICNAIYFELNLDAG